MKLYLAQPNQSTNQLHLLDSRECISVTNKTEGHRLFGADALDLASLLHQIISIIFSCKNHCELKIRWGAVAVELLHQGLDALNLNKA